MPPTAFAPSHTTPFKSTLSSSVQPRRFHSPFQPIPASSIHDTDADADAGPPLQLHSIDPRHWSYHAEGGHSLLLRYTPPASPHHPPDPRWTGTALRLTKAARSSTSSSTAAQPTGIDPHDRPDAWIHPVLLPLLGGDASLLAGTVPVAVRDARDRSTLETLAARVELHRPRERRNLDGIDLDATRAWLVEDLCAPQSPVQDGGVLTVEIKPKWGYLPQLPADAPYSALKARYPRYKMHKLVRSASPRSITAADLDGFYDPLDLYSGDPVRMATALAALWRDWHDSGGTTNNWRLFWNGTRVLPTQTDVLDAIALHLHAASRSDLLPALTAHLLPALQTAPLNPHASTPARALLPRLAELQATLDSRDISGLSADWTRLTGHPLGSPHTLPATLLASPTLAELRRAVALPPAAALDPAGSIDALRTYVLRFLVAATLKDCSVMVRVGLPRVRGAEVGGSGSGERNENEQYDTPPPPQPAVKLVDLDLKPISKLAKFDRVDREVCAGFSAWLQAQDPHAA